MAEAREKRDLVLPPGAYAFMQDTTKGVVKVYTGPTVINPSAQEVPVVYDPRSGTFTKCASLDEAERKSIVLPEGYYSVLLNPAKNGTNPSEGQSQTAVDLDIGRKVIVPGPAMFSLWPGQDSELVRGHHLHSNQYLLVRVYNEEQAKKNWNKAIIKPATTTASEGGSEETKTELTKAPAPTDLTVGKLLIIKGTEVSFYIPPTGITVIADGVDNKGKPNYVRDALTLERLEYAILVNENGEKRYANGPTVVFPEPTERFLEAKGDNGISRKFHAIELNEIQGIHLKVIAEYEENGRVYKAGEELFITGKDTAIYYPREEHSAVKYDGKTKHFATAIPAGEARYVLNRTTGEIRTVKGPTMLLPDPRKEVIVRRVLTDKQSSLWYPGNVEALTYNQSLRQVLSQVPTTRGAPSEGDVARNLRGKFGDLNKAAAVINSTLAFGDQSRTSREQGYVGNEFSYSSSYTQPRTLTLDTKYQGAPTIEVWTGYAVLAVNKTGGRRVVQGPAVVTLDYDESLEVLELSTGKPKTTDTLYRTVFLRTENNQVTDTLTVETADHVKVDLKLSYRVNFENDSTKWWSVENYVKFLCDHMRSTLKGAVKRLRIADFYGNSTEILKGMVLSDKGSFFFPENNLRVTDVEVLNVVIADANIRQMLDNSQTDVVRSNIELANGQRQLDVTKQKEQMNQEAAQIQAETQKLRSNLQVELAASALAVSLAKLGNELQEMAAQADIQQSELTMTAAAEEERLRRQKTATIQELELAAKRQAQKIEMLKAEAEATVQKFGAAQGQFTEALLALSNNETMVKVAEAWNIQRAIGGESIVGALQSVFAGTPLSGLVNKMTNDQIIAQHTPLGNGTTNGASKNGRV